MSRRAHYEPLSHDALVAIVVELLDERDRLVAAAEEVKEIWPKHVEVYVEGQGHRVYHDAIAPAFAPPADKPENATKGAK